MHNLSTIWRILGLQILKPLSMKYLSTCPILSPRPPYSPQSFVLSHSDSANFLQGERLCSTCRYYRVLTMVYNTQRYWVFGLCPSSGFFLNNNEKTQRFGNWICFHPQVRENTYSVGSLGRE
jgi:hypothetical protein